MKKYFIFLMYLMASHIGFSQSMFLNPDSRDTNEIKNLITVEKTKLSNGTEKTDTIKSVTSVVNDDKRFYFFGTSSVNSTDELLQSYQASQKVQFLARLVKQEPGNKKFWSKLGVDFTGAINVINIKPKGIKKDSLDFVSLMFPETGNFGLMLNPAIHWGRLEEPKGTHIFSSEFSYSLRQNQIDSIYLRDTDGNQTGDPQSISFSALNLNVMPIRYTYRYTPEEDTEISFSLGLYLNWFNIPNEDVENFNLLFPFNDPLFTDRNRSNLPSMGLKMACNINGFILFADIRQNGKGSNYRDDNPFKGFVFNVGFAQNVKIFGI